MRALLVSLLVASAITHGALAADPPEVIEGAALPLGGDTMRIGEARVRLWGVDAPEIDAPFGPRARAALDDLVAGETVRCQVVDRDRYGIPVARCAAAGRDLGAALIGQGLVLADRHFSGDAYRADEKAARTAGLGLWADSSDRSVETSSADALREWAKALGPAVAIFLAALVGFAGVIVTQVINARLAREQVTDEREREAQRRREEIKSIALALQAEIRAYGPGLTSRVEILGVVKDDSRRRSQEQFKLLAPEAPEIYPKVIDRLGMIEAQLASKIVGFYRELQIYREAFLLFAESEASVAAHVELHLDKDIKRFRDLAELADELCTDLQAFADRLDA